MKRIEKILGVFVVLSLVLQPIGTPGLIAIAMAQSEESVANEEGTQEISKERKESGDEESEEEVSDDEDDQEEVQEEDGENVSSSADKEESIGEAKDEEEGKGEDKKEDTSYGVVSSEKELDLKKQQGYILDAPATVVVEETQEEHDEGERGEWKEDEDGSWTIGVEEGKRYELKETGFSIEFTDIDQEKNKGNEREVSVKEIILSDEQMTELGALSRMAWDVTSTMDNGTFEYELTLPVPEGVDGEETQVIYAEDKNSLKDDAKTVDQDDTEVDEQEKQVKVKDLDHFTVFVVKWNFPEDSSDNVADEFNSYNIGKTLSAEGTNAPTFNTNGHATKSARATGWNDGNNSKYWMVEFDTTGYENIVISSKQKSSSTGPSDFRLEYRIEGGSWIDLGKNISIEDNWTTGVLSAYAMPSDVSNKEKIFVRWIMNSNDAVGNGSVGSSGANAIDDIEVWGDRIGDPVDNDTIGICHASNATSNPYIQNSPNKSGNVNGHVNHTGPVWDESMEQGDEWGDIIPPFWYKENGANGAEKFYPGMNWSEEGRAIWENDCQTGSEESEESVCGNAMLEDGEQCDWGDQNGSGYCSAQCTYEQNACLDGQNMVFNGGFEMPLVTHAKKWNIFDDMQAGLGWSVEWEGGSSSYMNMDRPEKAFLELHAGVNDWNPYSGNQHAELDTDWDGPDGNLQNEPASVSISQSIGLMKGYEYEVSYAFSPRPKQNVGDNVLEFSWDGDVKDTHSASGGNNVDWQKKTHSFVADDSGLTEIRFTDKGTPNSLGTLLDEVQVMCKGPVQKPCEPGKTWAYQVTGGEQGKTKGGSAIKAVRSNPDDVLDEADAVSGTEGGFYSLGKGGTLEVMFEHVVEDGTGNDLIFYEETWNDPFKYGEETAHVYGKQTESGNWVLLGEVTNHATEGKVGIDLSGSELSWVKYIRLEDTTDYSKHTNDGDGYDLDAIEGAWGLCYTPEPDPDPKQPLEACKYDFSVNNEKDLEIINLMAPEQEYTDELAFGSSAGASHPDTGDVYYIARYDQNKIAYYDISERENVVLGMTGMSGVIDKLAFRADGTLFAMSVSGELYAVDYDTTPGSTLIGTALMSPKTDGGDLVFDDRGDLIVIVKGGNVYEVDTGDASVTLLGDSNIEATGMTFKDGTFYVTDNSKKLYSFTRVTINSPETVGDTKDINDLASCPVDPKEQPGKILVNKFEDLNFDGKYNAGENAEPGIAEWTFRLYDEQGSQVGNDQTTGPKGWTTFKEVKPGSYEICEVMQEDWMSSDLAYDNAFLGENEGEICRFVNVDSGETIHNFRFANYRYGKVVIQKYHDLNRDGEKKNWGENKEPGLKDWEFVLYDQENQPVGQSQMTGPNGYTTFKDLLPGTYSVCEIMQDGWTSSSLEYGSDGTYQNEKGEVCRDIAVTSHETVGNIWFGNYPNGVIHGYKWHDRNVDREYENGDYEEQSLSSVSPMEEKLPDWTIFLDDNGNGLLDDGERSTLTSDEGEHYGWYWFENLLPGEYRVCEVIPDGWKQTYPGFLDEPSCHDVRLPDGNNQKYPVTTNAVTGPEYNFGNTELGEVIVTKFNDENGNGVFDEDEEVLGNPSFEMVLTGVYGGDIKPTELETDGIEYRGSTDENGQIVFSNLVSNDFRLTEDNDANESGWEQTGVSCRLMEDQEEEEVFDPRGVEESEPSLEAEFSLGAGETIECFVGNMIRGSLAIDKVNDASGSMERGDLVKYTIVVEAREGEVKDVKVTDLPPESFEFVSGSESISSSNRGNLASASGLGLTKTYASPGEWTLGNMEEGEVVTIAYNARIGGDVDAGIYPDVAYAQGLGRGGALLAVADGPGSVGENFAGTSVEIENATEPESVDVNTDIEEEIVPRVLGTSTLPATGADTSWIVLASSLLFIGFVLLASTTDRSVRLRREIKKHVSRVSIQRFFSLLLLVTIVGMISPAQAQEEISLIVRSETPKENANESFRYDFVALETQGNPVEVECTVKVPESTSFQVFETHSLQSGGDSGVCVLDEPFLDKEGQYTLQVVATANGRSAKGPENIVNYDSSRPGKPEWIKVDDQDDCEFDVKFRTADDGQTSYVEIYRDKDSEFEADNDSLVKTVSIGPDSIYEFTDKVPVKDCKERNYYAIRAFDDAGNASRIRTEEITETTEKVAEASEGDEGVTLGTGADVAGADATTTEESEVSEGEEIASQGDGEVAGEETEVSESNEETSRPGMNTSAWFWLIVAFLILGYFSWKQYKSGKKSEIKQVK